MTEIHPTVITVFITLVLIFSWGLTEFLSRKEAKKSLPPRYKIITVKGYKYVLKERELRFTRSGNYWGYVTIATYDSVAKAKSMIKHFNHATVGIE